MNESSGLCLSKDTQGPQSGVRENSQTHRKLIAANNFQVLTKGGKNV